MDLSLTIDWIRLCKTLGIYFVEFLIKLYRIESTLQCLKLFVFYFVLTFFLLLFEFQRKGSDGFHITESFRYFPEHLLRTAKIVNVLKIGSAFFN